MLFLSLVVSFGNSMVRVNPTNMSYCTDKVSSEVPTKILKEIAIWECKIAHLFCLLAHCKSSEALARCACFCIIT